MISRSLVRGAVLIDESGLTDAGLDFIMDQQAGILGPTAAGITVTNWRALQFAQVAAIQKAISEDLAKLPFPLLRIDGAGGKAPAVDHPVHQILSAKPNPSMTSMTYRQLLWGHVLNWGNHYSFIERRPRDRAPMELWPLNPTRMSKVAVNPETGRRAYLYRTPQGREEALDHDEVLHVYGLSFDGVIGYDPISFFLRESLGQAIGVEKYGAEFFDSPVPLHVLHHPQRFKNDKEEADFWAKWNKTIKERRRFALLQHGDWEIKTLDRIPNDAAQFIGTRRFMKEELAMFYRMPRHKLADIEQRAQTSIEQQNKEYVTDCLSPWASHLEQAVSLFLLTDQERATLQPRHNFHELLRGDAQAESTYIGSLVQRGVITPDEGRAQLDMAMRGGAADELYMQVNMAPLELIPDILTAKARGSQPQEPTGRVGYVNGHAAEGAGNEATS